jgi:hypothetical protein
VSKDIVNAPTARSWRDIPQPVKSRAMSRGGQWRWTFSVLRVVAGSVIVAGVGWGLWELSRSLQEDSKKMPVAAKTVAVKNFDLKTDGVVDAAWLERTLALPKTVSLTELDLAVLRRRLLASGQVTAAKLDKEFPETLKISLSERSPVTRVKGALRGEQITLLVARDGTVYEGVGYNPLMIDALPWLDGVQLTLTDDRWAPISNMPLVAELLSQAQIDTVDLYKTWQVVSLARLEKYHELEVRTKPGTTVVFAAQGDFQLQLAKLDYQWEQFAALPSPPVRVDLSLGRDVAVEFQTVTVPKVTRASAEELRAAAARSHSFFSYPLGKTKL